MSARLKTTPERRRAWPAAATAAICATAFFPALKNGFVWDDRATLLINPIFRRLSSRSLAWMLTTFHMGPYQPLSWLSYALDFHIWGMNPLGYHLTNVALHAASAALFFPIARRLLGAKTAVPAAELDWAAALAALFFAVHPLRVESVAWITERRDVLSGFFYMSALGFYLRRFDPAPPETARRRYLLCFYAYLLSLGAKGIGVAFPIVLVILDRLVLGREGRAVWLEKIPFALAALAAGGLGYLGQQRARALIDVGHYGWPERIGQAFYGLAFHFAKTFWPSGLLPLYELPQHIDPAAYPYNACAALVIVLAAAAILLRRRFPSFLAACLAYAAAMLPVSGLVHFGPQLTADRHSYLACLPWPLLAAGAVLSAPRAGRKTALAGATVAAAALALLTWRQCGIWKDDETLWRYAVDAAPNQSIPHDELGQALAEQGKIEEAALQFETAVLLNPENTTARYNLGLARERQGRAGQAVAEYRMALRLHPGYPAAGTNLGLLLAKQGRLDEAAASYREVLAQNPDYAPAHLNLGIVFANRKLWEEAAAEFRQALRVYPAYPEARFNLELAERELAKSR